MDNKGIPKAKRLPLEFAAKMWVEVGIRDRNGKCATEAGWCYRWYKGLHLLCAEAKKAANSKISMNWTNIYTSHPPYSKRISGNCGILEADHEFLGFMASSCAQDTFWYTITEQKPGQESSEAKPQGQELSPVQLTCSYVSTFASEVKTWVYFYCSKLIWLVDSIFRSFMVTIMHTFCFYLTRESLARNNTSFISDRVVGA